MESCSFPQIFAAAAESCDVSAIVDRMHGIGDKIFAAEARADPVDLYPLPGAEVREADTGSARLHEILAALEQNRAGQLVSFCLSKNRPIDHPFLASIGSFEQFDQVTV